MNTNPPMQHTETVAAHRNLKPVAGSSWISGFDNMFGKEMSDWFHTRRWLSQTIVWIGIINVFLAFLLFVVPTMEPSALESDPMSFGLAFFFQMALIGGTIGTIILSQDEIVGEKQTGTAAWILSKPVSRTAFILSKLAANTIGILIFIVLIPGIIAIAELSMAAQRSVAIPSFLLGLGVLLLGLFFYLTLTLMLGVLFHQRGGVIGIGLGLFFGASLMINFIPELVYLMPVQFQTVAPLLAIGQPLPKDLLIEIGVTAAWCVVFMAVALWRFENQEL